MLLSRCVGWYVEGDAIGCELVLLEGEVWVLVVLEVVEFFFDSFAFDLVVCEFVEGEGCN